MADQTFAGQFLAATPLIATPPFSRSVIFLLEHDDTGAIGVILNADSGLPLAELLPEAAPYVVEPPTVFMGGPVSTETALGLARAPHGSFLRPAALGTIGLVNPTEPPSGVSAMRIFAGYAGWDPGQLEAEIEEGAWWVTLADVDAIFADTTNLWRETLRRAPGRIPLFETYTDDPAAN
ncbi:MAG: YqgE/AlgH family protein [Actinomycetota bacterium]